MLEGLLIDNTNLCQSTTECQMDDAREHVNNHEEGYYYTVLKSFGLMNLVFLHDIVLHNRITAHGGCVFLKQHHSGCMFVLY